MTPAGYSGTPLAKKLGIAAGSNVVARSAPANYAELVRPLPENVHFDTTITPATDIVHVFVESKSALSKQLAEFRTKLRSDAAVWVSWPKKASGVATDITEDGIREVALPLGWVDVKVCAVDAVWSGLKLVVRRQLR